MLLSQFYLGNNLAAHIRENTDFLWEKPRKVSRRISKAVTSATWKQKNAT